MTVLTGYHRFCYGPLLVAAIACSNASQEDGAEPAADTTMASSEPNAGQMPSAEGPFGNSDTVDHTAPTDSSNDGASAPNPGVDADPDSTTSEPALPGSGTDTSAPAPSATTGDTVNPGPSPSQSPDTAAPGTDTTATDENSQPGGVDPGTTPCDVTVTHSMSEVIPTVAIVEWSTPLTVQSATVEFGLNTDYGLNAPVNLEEPNYRTLLLGMKHSREYHFRVALEVDGETCHSQDFTLETGPAPNALLDFEVDTPLPEQVAQGYAITAYWSEPGGPAFILDADRDIVWWYDDGSEDDIFRARMSYDGKWMWTRNTAQVDRGVVRRVTLDGLQEEQWELDNTTHDFAVLPDGKVGLLAHATSNTCDEVQVLDPETGEVETIFNLADAHGKSDCHANAIVYQSRDDSFTISEWAESSYIKISRQGELLWTMNGDDSDFSGTDWVRQHSLHFFEADKFVMFSNGGDGQPTAIIQYSFDEDNLTAEEMWRYTEGPTTMFGGDVQRLPNGNTIITYGNSGVLHEINAERQLVQEITWPLGNAVNCVSWRESLYGPPPRIDN